MNYALRLAGDAVVDLRALAPWLAEDVLDEVESIARDPGTVRVDSQGEFVHDFERGSGAERVIVFLRLHRDDQAGLITILAIAACARPR